MVKLRSELRKGVLIFIFFIIMVTATDILLPDSVNITEYQDVSPERLKDNALLFEGKLVATSGVISNISIDTSNSDYFVETYEELIFRIPLSLGNLSLNTRVNVRGTSLITSAGYIDVTEIHVSDSIGPILRSLPGIILFVILFFIVFRMDFQNFAFIPRRASYA